MIPGDQMKRLLRFHETECDGSRGRYLAGTIKAGDYLLVEGLISVEVLAGEAGACYETITLTDAGLTVLREPPQCQ